MSDDKNILVRWQSIARQQLSFVNNLIVGLSTILLAFQLNITFNENTKFDNISEWLLSFSIGFVFISIILGCLTAWNRLKDFRLTKEIVRNKKVEDDLKYVEELRTKTHYLGVWTLRLLKFQLLFFVFGLIFITSLLIFNLAK